MFSCLLVRSYVWTFEGNRCSRSSYVTRSVQVCRTCAPDGVHVARTFQGTFAFAGWVCQLAGACLREAPYYADFFAIVSTFLQVFLPSNQLFIEHRNIAYVRYWEYFLLMFSGRASMYLVQVRTYCNPTEPPFNSSFTFVSPSWCN